MGRKGDMVRPWKPPVAFYVLMLVLGLYFAIITAGVWEDGDNIYTVFSKIMAIAKIMAKTVMKMSATLKTAKLKISILNISTT